MEKTEIVLNDDILTTKDAVSTTFFIKHGDFCFPDSQWTDLTSSVFGMWAYRLKNLPEGTTRLFFMDGPYRLDVFKDGENLKIDCVCFRSGNKTEHSFECSFRDFKEAFCGALEKFCRILYLNDMNKGENKPIYAQMQMFLKEFKNP